MRRLQRAQLYRSRSFYRIADISLSLSLSLSLTLTHTHTHTHTHTDTQRAKKTEPKAPRNHG